MLVVEEDGRSVGGHHSADDQDQDQTRWTDLKAWALKHQFVALKVGHLGFLSSLCNPHL